MKMYKQFLKEYEGGMKVKYNYYYGVFISYFNLGFGSPKKLIYALSVSRLKRQLQLLKIKLEKKYC